MVTDSTAGPPDDFTQEKTKEVMISNICGVMWPGTTFIPGFLEKEKTGSLLDG